MFRRRPFDANRRRGRSGGTGAISDAVAGMIDANPAKALVMAYLRQLVADGLADWQVLDNGDTELHLRTGEVFLLAETVIIRLA